MKDDNPGWLFYVVVGALCVALMVWFSRPERYDDCRDSCARRGFTNWTYDPVRTGCSCGGSTKQP